MLLPLLTLLVCLISSISSDVSSYFYPQPPLETLPDPPVYLPPVFQEEIPQIPINDYLPPYPPAGVNPPEIFNDEDTISIAPSPLPPSLYQPPNFKMKVLNMSCILNNSFKSTIKFEGRSNLDPPPVIENAPNCSIIPSTTSTFVINMEGLNKIVNCGVKKCLSRNNSVNMCVAIRMPTVKGLKLPEDSLITLQCIPQESVVSHTKHLRLSTSSKTKSRSNNAVIANGGSRNNFNSYIVLMRKPFGGNSFNQPLENGAIIPLGEEIVLRATIQDGDGWKYSKMGPVTIRSATSKKSMTLVEENGCRSPGIKTICPYQPQQLNPLDTVLHFRAFLFQESGRGDEMLLSVKMLGCINHQDCFQNGVCDRANLTPPVRFKRNAGNDTSWESQIKFKVELPEPNISSSSNVGLTFLIVVMLFSSFVLLIVSCLLHWKK